MLDFIRYQLPNGDFFCDNFDIKKPSILRMYSIFRMDECALHYLDPVPTFNAESGVCKFSFPGMARE